MIVNAVDEENKDKLLTSLLNKFQKDVVLHKKEQITAGGNDAYKKLC